MTTDAIQQVLSALSVLYTNPDAVEKEKADAWLGEFRKDNEAWSTAQLILFAPDTPLEAKLFAAQTFRMKVTYDLDQLPRDTQMGLRASLVTAIREFASGPRVILTQLCLALADLAIQTYTEDWPNPVGSLIDQFREDPNMAGALLEFTQVIAEEYLNNTKFEARNNFGRRDYEIPVTEETKQVLALLTMYLQAPGITTKIQTQCFACLGAWLRCGQIGATTMAGTPILAALFDSLSNDELFDTAVDCIVDLIHETQELDENVGIIQELVPRISALRPNVLDPTTREDEDKMRGYCRLFVEAGEWYAPLIIAHLDSFLPLVNAIADCASCEHLSIIEITLNFWYRLAKATRPAKDDPEYQPLVEVFSNLVGTIIRHLHYPYDDASFVGQEKDDFRNFRHTIGDTLKDCCGVLGATNCLRRSYEIVARTLQTPGEHKWQDIEAPLFSMRSMGAEVDPEDREVLPLIMDLIPKLPPQPRIRYAAILVIGRYTRWINLHPEYIQFLLPYVSSGFEDPDAEVMAASAQTMKYLCKDCSAHLIPFLDQLHSFTETIAPRLGLEDLLDISAAIAHIIDAMPRADFPQTLSTFLMPLVKSLHALTTQTAPVSRQDLKTACATLSRIDIYLEIVTHYPDQPPAACKGTCEQMWQVFDAFLTKFHADSAVVEKTCTVIRRGMTFFADETALVAPQIVEKMATCFESAPASSYVWITSRMLFLFASKGDSAFLASVSASFARFSSKIFALLQGMPPAQLADILDDYVMLVNEIIDCSPSILFLSPLFPAVFQTLLSTLTLYTPQIIFTSLDALRSIIGHECIQAPPPPPTFQATSAFPAPPVAYPPEFAAAIRSTVAECAPQMVAILLLGLVDGVEDQSTSVLTLLRIMSIEFTAQLGGALPAALEQLPEKLATPADKTELSDRFAKAIQSQNPNQVKDAFTWFLRASRKNRERERVSMERS